MFQDIIERVYLGNSIAAYLIFVGLFLAVFCAIKIFHLIILKRLKKWAEKTTTTIDDFIFGIIQRLVLPLAYFNIRVAGLAMLMGAIFPAAIYVAKRFPLNIGVWPTQEVYRGWLAGVVAILFSFM